MLRKLPRNFVDIFTKAAAEAEDRTAAPQAAPRPEPLLARLGGLVTTAVTSVTRLLTGSGQPAAASPLEKRVSGPGLATPSPALPPVLLAGLAAIGVGVVGLMSVGGAAVSLMFNSLYLGFYIHIQRNNQTFLQ